MLMDRFLRNVPICLSWLSRWNWDLPGGSICGAIVYKEAEINDIVRNKGLDRRIKSLTAEHELEQLLES